MVSIAQGISNFQNFKTKILKEEPRILGMSYTFSVVHPARPQPSVEGKEGGKFL